MAKRSNNSFKISRNVASQKQQGKIPLGADNYKDNADLASRKFSIGYEHYNHTLCEVGLLKQAPLRKIIENCKKFGKCATVLELKSQGITFSPVTNSNWYSQLYAGLEPDIELKEFDTGENERAFFFIDTYKNVVQMVAYTNAHLENNKQKK